MYMENNCPPNMLRLRKPSIVYFNQNDRPIFENVTTELGFILYNSKDKNGFAGLIGQPWDIDSYRLTIANQPVLTNLQDVERTFSNHFKGHDNLDGMKDSYDFIGFGLNAYPMEKYYPGNYKLADFLKEHLKKTANFIQVYVDLWGIPKKNQSFDFCEDLGEKEIRRYMFNPLSGELNKYEHISKKDI